MIVTPRDADSRLLNRFGANWWYCFYPEHVAFVSKSWPDRALVPDGWSVLRCETFWCRQLGLARRLVELLLLCAYGLVPRQFLRVGNAFERFMGKGAMLGAPGNGVAADHRFIVLRKPQQS